MKRSVVRIAGVIGALAITASAEAADMPGTWPLPSETPARYYELMSGWYLRGDLGYRLNRMATADTFTPVTSQSFDNAIGATVGWGYKYQWFRAEASFDYGSPAKYTGTTAAAVTQPQYFAKIRSMSVMANGYIDLGTWAGFTPYVGAGAGITRLHSEHYADTSLPPNPLANIKSEQTNFSWAAMAGVAFKVTPSWMIDIGYRYIDMGDLAATGATGLPGDATTFRRLTAQEGRVGFRFLFD